VKEKHGFSTIEYLVGAGVVVAIALGVFIYTLLPAVNDMEDYKPDIYYSDYYQSNN